MTAQPSRRTLALTEPGEIRYRKGMPFGEWQRLMAEKPHPPPCVHPFDPLGWDITTCRHLQTGLLIVHSYQCRACGELLDTIHTPLKEILR